jgi:putative ABC transport system ATP-binding protein
MDLFLSLCDSGLTISMVTHDAKIAGHADRIIAMNDGAMAEDNPVVAPGPTAASA